MTNSAIPGNNKDKLYKIRALIVKGVIHFKGSEQVLR
jgi:hypothetical protein